MQFTKGQIVVATDDGVDVDYEGRYNYRAGDTCIILCIETTGSLDIRVLDGPRKGKQYLGASESKFKPTLTTALSLLLQDEIRIE